MSSEPKRLRGFFQRAAHRVLVAHVDRERPGALPPACSISAAALWLVPGSLGCWRVGLGRDRDVGAVARGAQRDRQADAARGAGDEQGSCL